jgi:hypothetical protein
LVLGLRRLLILLSLNGLCILINKNNNRIQPKHSIISIHTVKPIKNMNLRLISIIVKVTMFTTITSSITVDTNIIVSNQ